MVAIRRRSVRPLAGLTLAVAGVVVLFVASRLRYTPIDPRNLQLALFELCAATAAGLAFTRVRAAAYVTGAVFALHTLISVAAVAFAFLFRITRLM